MFVRQFRACISHATHGQSCRSLVVWFALPFSKSLVEIDPDDARPLGHPIALRSKKHFLSPKKFFLPTMPLPVLPS